jgi:S-adenosylmethionine-dependent methyltransferase
VPPHFTASGCWQPHLLPAARGASLPVAAADTKNTGSAHPAPADFGAPGGRSRTTAPVCWRTVQKAWGVNLRHDVHMGQDPAPEDAWAPLVERFVDAHYSSLRGRVRTHVIHEHLKQHMRSAPQRVVDIGGGAGNQSVPLARDGHEVTLVDPSPAMLDRAAARLREQEEHVASRVRLVHATGEEAPDALGGETFDAVLCHGVFMYLDEPEPMLNSLCQLAAPAGIVSIVAKNAEVMALRHAHEGDWAAAIAVFDSDRQINGLGVATRGDRIGHLSTLLAERAVDPEAWYGVRLFTDGWTAERPATDPEALVLEAELIASHRDPYRQLSRLFHLIARRQA